jgi:hypothetical protein
MLGNRHNNTNIINNLACKYQVYIDIRVYLTTLCHFLGLYNIGDD